MNLSRRQFIKLGAYSIPTLCISDGFFIETESYKINHLSIGNDSNVKCVHISDIHFKGDREYLSKVIDNINSIGPDLVFFTGDLVEDLKFLDEALELLAKIKPPVYGVPGNHDYISKAPFPEISKTFEKTGGAWLIDEFVELPEFGIKIFGATCNKELQHNDTGSTILLAHYPAFVNKLNRRYKLILSGHSHGGQVRIPFWGPLILPPHVDKYDLGMFDTSAGTLYVNSGLGYWYLPVRFCCRPEIAVLSI